MSVPILCHRAKLAVLAAIAALYAVAGSTQVLGQPQLARLVVPGQPPSIPDRNGTDCLGDVDGDNDVDLDDLAGLLASYGACAGDLDFNPAADIDGDGCVLLSDLAALLAVYGTDCMVAGDVCDDPVRVTLGIWDLPYQDTNTTCGRGNDCQDTCLGYYDGGEDIIYELTVVDPIGVEILLDPEGTNWTGVLIDDTCPPGSSCIAYSGCPSGPHIIENVYLDPGVYYVMVDTWPAPDCIPQFTLTIANPLVHCWVECPPGANIESEPCGADTNGGCSMDPPQFEPIACGDTVCGTIWANCGERDNDWYEVTVAENTKFTWTVDAEFEMLIGLVETDPPGSADCFDMIGLNPFNIGPCGGPLSITTDVLPPGTYWFYVAHADFFLTPCGEWNDYVATLSCTALPVP